MSNFLTRIGLLADALLRYLFRRVLSSGPLRSWPLRVALGVMALVLLIGGAVAAVLFLRPVGADIFQWWFIFDVFSLSMLPIGIVGCMALRLLVDGSQNLTEFTYQLPVNHQERRAAVLIFEIGFMLVVSLLFTFALSSAAVFQLGTYGLLLASTSPATIMLAYLLCLIGYNLGDFLLTVLGLRRLRLPILVMAMLASVLLLLSQTFSMLNLVSLPGEAARRLIGPNLFSWLLARYGAGIYLPVMVFGLLLLSLIALYCARSSPPETGRFVNIPQPRWVSGVWLAHFGYTLRNQNLWMSVPIVVVLFGYLLSIDGPNPLLAGALLALPGMYHYGNTRSLRILHPEGSALKIWATIISTQLSLVGGFLIVGFGLLLLRYPDLFSRSPAVHNILASVGGVLATVLLMVLIGCAFPAEKDNPMGALAGLIVLMICLSFAAVMGSLIGMSNLVFAVIVVLLLAAVVAGSIWSIAIHEKRSREGVNKAAAK